MAGNDSQDRIIKGPIHSLRFGATAVINILAKDFILCPFKPVYCSHSLPFREPSQNDYKSALPTPKQISDALARFLDQQLAIDYIVIAGNGEPTLHPYFDKVVDRILAVRDDFAPHLDVALISSSFNVGDEQVRATLEKVEVPILKLDAGDSVLFRKINRPVESVSFKSIVDGLTMIDRLYIQSVFMKGKISNMGENSLERWFKLIKEIKPVTVHLFTIAHELSQVGLLPVDNKDLTEIGEKLQAFAQVPYCVYGNSLEDLCCT